MISICVLRLTICLLIISFQGSPLGLVRLVRNLSKKKKRATNRPEGVSFAAYSGYYG